MINTKAFSIFLSSFLAATVLPFSSEVVLAALTSAENFYFFIFIATLGNTLGGLTTYLIGYFAKIDWALKYFRISEKDTQKAQAFISERGDYVAFFCFLPLIGEPLAFVLGAHRYNIYKVTAYMALGKFLRYLAVAWLARFLS